MTSKSKKKNKVVLSLRSYSILQPLQEKKKKKQDKRIIQIRGRNPDLVCKSTFSSVMLLLFKLIFFFCCFFFLRRKDS